MPPPVFRTSRHYCRRKRRMTYADSSLLRVTPCIHGAKTEEKRLQHAPHRTPPPPPDCSPSHLPHAAYTESAPRDRPLACHHLRRRRRRRWPPSPGHPWGPPRRQGRTFCLPSRSSRSTDALGLRTAAGRRWFHEIREKRYRQGTNEHARRARQEEKRTQMRAWRWTALGKVQIHSRHQPCAHFHRNKWRLAEERQVIGGDGTRRFIVVSKNATGRAKEETCSRTFLFPTSPAFGAGDYTTIPFAHNLVIATILTFVHVVLKTASSFTGARSPPMGFLRCTFPSYKETAARAVRESKEIRVAVYARRDGDEPKSERKHVRCFKQQPRRKWIVSITLAVQVAPEPNSIRFFFSFVYFLVCRQPG